MSIPTNLNPLGMKHSSSILGYAGGAVTHFDGIKNVALDQPHNPLSPIWYDLSGNNHNTTSVSNQPFINGNMLVDGTAEMGGISKNFKHGLTGSVGSIEICFRAVVRPTRRLDLSYWGTMFDLRTNLSTHNNLIQFSLRQGDNTTIPTLHLLMYDNAKSKFNNPINIDYSQKVRTATLVLNGVNRSFYLDGTLIPCQHPADLWSPPRDYAELSLSNHISTTGQNGWHSIRIYNRALTEKEIKHNHDNDVKRFT